MLLRVSKDKEAKKTRSRSIFSDVVVENERIKCEWKTWVQAFAEDVKELTGNEILNIVAGLGNVNNALLSHVVLHNKSGSIWKVLDEDEMMRQQTICTRPGLPTLTVATYQSQAPNTSLVCQGNYPRRCELQFYLYEGAHAVDRRSNA
jgi:hypothetical protein